MSLIHYFQNNLTWPKTNIAGISLYSRLKYSKLLTGMQTTLHSLGWCSKNIQLIQISSILSVNFLSMWHKCHRVFWWASFASARHAGNFWLSDDHHHSDHNGQWQKALCILAVQQSPQPNPQRNKRNWKMYAIKQIKICAKYRDMLPRPRLDLDLSGTPGLRHIGLSPGSWQTSLGLGSISRYFAQVLICIANYISYHIQYELVLQIELWDLWNMVVIECRWNWYWNGPMCILLWQWSDPCHFWMVHLIDFNKLAVKSHCVILRLWDCRAYILPDIMHTDIIKAIPPTKSFCIAGIFISESIV